ncbi:MAG: efflux RND transporter permease subunit [Candidatus Obscuribacter sp.]|nr:efflux RND transporter permease subunit [Candidatus Obscuribacter sp.]
MPESTGGSTNNLSGCQQSDLALHGTDYYAETILAQRISLAGVAQVQINGSQQFAVRVQVDSAQTQLRMGDQ